ncbi:hypothetical protein OAO42_01695, partial [Candidatus Izimaplasma bacterium]|nr:hypothetical protein [Candidatus Izimaplasma bacterium]
VFYIQIIVNKRYPKLIRYGLIISWVSVIIGSISSVLIPLYFPVFGDALGIGSFMMIRGIVGMIVTLIRTIFYAYILYYFFKEEEVFRTEVLNDV